MPREKALQIYGQNGEVVRPDHRVTSTLTVGKTGCPLRIRHARSSYVGVRSKSRFKFTVTVMF